MNLIKKAVLSGLIVSTSALIVSGTIVAILNKKRIINKLENMQFKENKSAKSSYYFNEKQRSKYV